MYQAAGSCKPLVANKRAALHGVGEGAAHVLSESMMGLYAAPQKLVRVLLLSEPELLGQH